MEDIYRIQGGRRLSGELTVSGAKNAAAKIIIAALLYKSKVRLANVPRIGDVEELINLIRSLGAGCKFVEENTLEIDPSTLVSNKVDFLHSSRIRTSFMLFAPLLYRFGECYIPNPAGCRLGERSIDRIIEGMRTLGIDVTYDPDSGYYHAVLKKKPEGIVHFAKPSHTGTELMIMLSIFAHGEVIIENAAAEPEVDNLIEFLNQSGCNIARKMNNIHIQGVRSIVAPDTFHIMPDRLVAATYATLAVATEGEIVLKGITSNLLSEYLTKLKKANIGVEDKGEAGIRVYYMGKIAAVDIVTAPHPGFMTDWQPLWAVLMTQADGVSVIHERIYENRFAYVSELKKLGADIEFISMSVENPSEYYHFNWVPNKKYQQAIQIKGGNHLHSGVLDIADLRAGATLAIAACVAAGESVIKGAAILDRGYEDFAGRVTSLGGIIKKE